MWVTTTVAGSLQWSRGVETKLYCRLVQCVAACCSEVMGLKGSCIAGRCSVLQCVACVLQWSRGVKKKKTSVASVGGCVNMSQLYARNIRVPTDSYIHTHTGWRRLVGFPKLQIIFHKRATKYRSLLRKMTYKDKGSYESSPPCMHTHRELFYSYTDILTHLHTHTLVRKLIIKKKYTQVSQKREGEKSVWVWCLCVCVYVYCRNRLVAAHRAGFYDSQFQPIGIVLKSHDIRIFSVSRWNSTLG